MTPSHVLVPLDGSPLSGEALEHAITVFDCRITVLNIVTPLDSQTSEGPVLEPDKDRVTEARDWATEITEDVRKKTGEEDQIIQTIVAVGEPAKTILEYIESHDIDHVVMGSHSRELGRLRRRLLGTVSTAVIGEAPVSVTVIR